MVPKLVAEDIPLLFSLLSDVFPGIEYRRADMDELKKHIRDVSSRTGWEGSRVCLVFMVSRTFVGLIWVRGVFRIYFFST